MVMAIRHHDNDKDVVDINFDRSVIESNTIFFHLVTKRKNYCPPLFVF